MDLRRQEKEQKRDPNLIRSARFVETEEGWFFRTREDIMLGPYQNKFDAELSASLLVARLAQLEEGADPAPLIQSFENDPSNAKLRHNHQQKPIDIKAIRRKNHMHSAVSKVQKVWTAISNLKSRPKNLKLKQ